MLKGDEMILYDHLKQLSAQLLCLKFQATPWISNKKSDLLFEESALFTGTIKNAVAKWKLLWGFRGLNFFSKRSRRITSSGLSNNNLYSIVIIVFILRLFTVWSSYCLTQNRFHFFLWSFNQEMKFWNVWIISSKMFC